MRIARWETDGRLEEGLVHGDRVIPFPDGTTTAGLLAAGLATALEVGAEMLAAADGRGTALAAVRLLAPLQPSSIRDFVAFEEHVEGVSVSVDGRGGVSEAWYRYPTFYFTNPHSVLGPDERVTPPRCEALDFELEVAVVVGAPPRDGSDLTPGEGAEAIFGYTIMNDWSARDVQAREMQVRLGPAKGKDFGTALGPWIVTADEFADLVDDEGFLPLELEALVNGERVGHDLLSNMGWPLGELVAYASRNTRVVPGDLLGSGTAGNGGCLGELWGRNGARTPPPLVAGDTVTLRVERIGELHGIVGAAREVPEIPPARPRSRARTR
ncbi:fumarylacetoacetate hydrolase family protein [Leucobacter weissii]|uniref:Fumarylacetoacetate hydrolase family protein n=1 Tax=Leucobacter weissii TaxID=1983706 RepID=A0A939MKL1_9MICO|nr:fumarylacetoacetate hydrolase family protein [Leucobacter weissii]MBO1902703.1 fumarylacetoacetate hydrolase family protein [Leucobacter weissii]